MVDGARRVAALLDARVGEAVVVEREAVQRLVARVVPDGRHQQALDLLQRRPR